MITKHGKEERKIFLIYLKKIDEGRERLMYLKIDGGERKREREKERGRTKLVERE
jgi:hypothetical protein